MVILSDLVSIIIPTYNRADLLGETLDSILAQTYKNWEVLVIDDGSIDNTDTLMEVYTQSDHRIQYFQRPADIPKGGNPCRNMGITKAQGDFVIFFDSDDIMTPDHIESKLSGFTSDAIDFVITKTEYFNKPKHKRDHQYHLAMRRLSVINYLAQRVSWLTLDTCIRASIVNDLRFNETLKAGQEFNFYAKLLVKTTKGVFVPKVVSLRRYHAASIQSELLASNKKRVSSFLSKWNTYTDLKSYLNHKEKKTILYACIKLIIKLKKVPEGLFFKVLVQIFKVYGLAGINFVLLLLLIPFNRGYFFHERLRRLSIESS